jgi:flagellar biosynthesis/type III secretory pathway protein FliH
MSAVIKRDVMADIGALPIKSRPSIEPVVGPDPRDERIEALQRDIVRLTEELASSKAAAERAAQSARAEGHRSGLSEAARNDAARIEALRSGVSGALAAFRTKLIETDRLAAALTRRALDKMFDDAESYGDRLVRMIARHIRELESHGLISVAVSPADFATPEAFQAIEAVCAGVANVMLETSVKPGECRIRLELGDADCSMSGQRSELSALLDEMVAGR